MAPICYSGGRALSGGECRGVRTEVMMESEPCEHLKAHVKQMIKSKIFVWTGKCCGIYLVCHRCGAILGEGDDGYYTDEDSYNIGYDPPPGWMDLSKGD